MRLATRRPRRVLLGSLSIAITVSGIVAILFAHATLAVSGSGNAAAAANPGLSDVGFISQTARENQVLLIVTVMLAALAAVNIIFITWATVQDYRHAAAITRALGASAGQLTAGLSAAQVFRALAGALAGLAGGYGLFLAASQGGSVSQPPAWWLVAAVLSTMIVVTRAHLRASPAQHPPVHRRIAASGRVVTARSSLSRALSVQSCPVLPGPGVRVIRSSPHPAAQRGRFGRLALASFHRTAGSPTCPVH